jgi:hypothetical protein
MPTIRVLDLVAIRRDVEVSAQEEGRIEAE